MRRLAFCRERCSGVGRSLDKFLSAIQKFGVGRLAALIGVVVGAIAVIAFKSIGTPKSSDLATV